MPESPRLTVFVSHSHQDKLWKDRLLPHLGVLKQVGHITIWDDHDIGAGEDSYDEIKQVMEQAAVAVCLISADYLASDFVNKEEIPYLLERRARRDGPHPRAAPALRLQGLPLADADPDDPPRWQGRRQRF